VKKAWGKMGQKQGAKKVLTGKMNRKFSILIDMEEWAQNVTPVTVVTCFPGEAGKL
jgi:hypothetical protein